MREPKRGRDRGWEGDGRGCSIVQGGAERPTGPFVGLHGGGRGDPDRTHSVRIPPTE